MIHLPTRHVSTSIMFYSCQCCVLYNDTILHTVYCTAYNEYEQNQYTFLENEMYLSITTCNIDNERVREEGGGGRGWVSEFVAEVNYVILKSYFSKMMKYEIRNTKFFI